MPFTAASDRLEGEGITHEIEPPRTTIEDQPGAGGRRRTRLSQEQSGPSVPEDISHETAAGSRSRPPSRATAARCEVETMRWSPSQAYQSAREAVMSFNSSTVSSENLTST